MTSRRPRPSKPKRPFSAIAFSKSGKVLKHVENSEATTEQIERNVVNKLFAVLVQRGRPNVDSVTQGQEPADVLVRLADGTQIDVQVAEIVDPVMVRRKEMTDGYLSGLRKNHPRLLDLLRGMLVTILVRPDSPPLPNVKSAEGKRALNDLAAFIGQEAIFPTVLGPAKRRIRERAIAGQDVSVTFEHGRDVTEPVELYWPDGRLFSQGENRNFTTQAIRSKIDKRYARARNARFWLVLFASDTLPLSLNNPDFLSAQNLLKTSPHPFDEVWYIYPLANHDYGAVLQVWPPEPHAGS